MIENIESPFDKYWMPMNWCFNLCYYMRSKEKVWADNLLQGLIAVSVIII
jgi:hypothetical protein